MHGLKIDTNFFLKVLNGEWLVKHKPLEEGGNQDFRTPRVVNTGRVGVLKVKKNRLNGCHKLA